MIARRQAVFGTQTLIHSDARTVVESAFGLRDCYLGFARHRPEPPALYVGTFRRRCRTLRSAVRSEDGSMSAVAPGLCRSSNAASDMSLCIP